MSTDDDEPTKQESTRFIHQDLKLRIFVLTWNTNKNKNYDDLSDCLNDALHQEADIIAVGLQEVSRRHTPLLTALQVTTGSQHVLYAAEAFGTIVLAIFLRRQLIERCSDLVCSCVHLRVCNCYRTKGSTAVYFKLFGHSFLFLTSHLAAGKSQEKLGRRTDELRRIRGAVKVPKSIRHADRFNDVDFVFWSGDFNFRLSENRQSVESIVTKILHFEHLRQDEIRNLLAMDQLTMHKTSTLLNDFQEASIDFLPTYKFDPRTHQYDTSKKQRIPSYTDRILSRSRNAGQSIDCKVYSSPTGLVSSDHKPVFAAFEVLLRRPEVQNAGDGLTGQQKRESDLTFEHYRNQRKAAIRRRRLKQKISACGCGIV